MRLQIHDERYVCPNVSVVTEPPRHRDEKRRVLQNPSVVIEVLSESTAAYDRGEKFALYREVESLRGIVWIDSGSRWAEVAGKTDGVWTLPGPVTADAVELPSLGLAIPFDELYRGVDELARARSVSGPGWGGSCSWSLSIGYPYGSSPSGLVASSPNWTGTIGVVASVSETAFTPTG